MITDNEIREFANILDKEYAEEILPLLRNAHEAIDEIIDFAHNEENRTMARMCKYDEYVRFECFKNEDELRKLFNILGYTTGTHFEIRNGGVGKDIPSILGYLNTSNQPLSFFLFYAEKYRCEEGYERRLETLKYLKKTFDDIKMAYNALFIENEGKVFHDFSQKVLDFCAEIKNKTEEKDNEFRALFSKPSKTKRFRVKISVCED